MYGYRTYHEELMRTLIKSIHSGNSSHAYIFEGEEGLNIFESAKLFAMALTCQNPDSAPCASCGSCIESRADTNPDIIYVEKPSDRKTIGVAPVRTLTDDAAIKPFASPKKVYIIREGDLLTEAAQNALLKTLEEPPEYAVFIIITTNRDILLPTVQSRTALVHFPPVPNSITEEYINEKYPEAENKEFLVKYCAGIPGRVDAVMENERFYAIRTQSLEKLPQLMTKNKLYAFEIRKYLDDEKDNADMILDFWISYLRDILVMQTTASEALMAPEAPAAMVINTDKISELRPLVQKLDPKITASALDELFRAKEMLRRYVSIKSMALHLALNINK